jgi:hypothetical protein
MTPEQRRQILGDDVIAQIQERVDAAPVPSPEVIDKIRPILTRPAGRRVKVRPAANAA